VANLKATTKFEINFICPYGGVITKKQVSAKRSVLYITVKSSSRNYKMCSVNRALRTYIIY
jgi:hypothetical protein